MYIYSPHIYIFYLYFIRSKQARPSNHCKHAQATNKFRLCSTQRPNPVKSPLHCQHAQIMNVFVSPAQQLRSYAVANQQQCRSKRPQQQAPQPFSSRNRPRRRVEASDPAVDDDTLQGLELQGTGDSESSQRVQRRIRGWQESRQDNSRSLQQYEAYQEADDQLKQRLSTMQLMDSRVQSALHRHCCCSVLGTDDVDACVTVNSSRPVACHLLGVSFWLSVPTVTCQACNSTWEVRPADVGCFGNTPVRPTQWFGKQLLLLYRQLALGGGLGTHTFAGACNAACAVSDVAAAAAVSAALPDGRDPVPSIDPR